MNKDQISNIIASTMLYGGLLLCFACRLRTAGIIVTGTLLLLNVALTLWPAWQSRRRIRRMEREEMEAFMERAKLNL